MKPLQLYCPQNVLYKFSESKFVTDKWCGQCKRYGILHRVRMLYNVEMGP